MSNWKTNPHLDWQKHDLGRPCSPNDTILVSEGVQCANCLVLVIDSRPDLPEVESPTRRILASLAGGS